MPLSRDEATVREGSVFALYFRIKRKDKHGQITNVRLDEISSLVLDFKNESDGATINSRSNQNVLNANNVTIDALGEVKWSVQAADTTVQDATLVSGKLEQHNAIFLWVLTDGSSSNHREELFIETETEV